MMHAPAVRTRGAAPARQRLPLPPARRHPVDVTLRAKAGCACGGACPACRAAGAREADAPRSEATLLREPMQTEDEEMLQTKEAEAGAPPAQPKLRIGDRDDPLEREADQVADQVMRMGDGDATASDETAELRRQPMEEEEEEQVPMRRDASPGPTSARAHAPAEDRTAGACAPGSVTSVLASAGAPLDARTRAFFEPRFGRSFGDVRVHADADAAASARDVSAEAYAVKNHLVFAPGRFAPQTRAGQHLLAHELAHVVQQQGVPSEQVRRYRSPKAVNFGAKDTADLKEKRFDPKAPDPYIKHIQIDFTATKQIDGESVPKGTLSATYAKNGASPMPADISGVGILGGFPSSGLTDKTKNNKVDRVEGWGYHHTSVPRKSRVGSKWPKYKYFKPAEGGQATMSYALFFKGSIAVHLGALDSGSLACVHVDDISTMRRLNYHARARVTKVSVSYSEAALNLPCCERYAVKGYMVSNPCGGRNPKDCP